MPVISDPVFGYKRVNVSAQRRDPDSLLNWIERMIRQRKECPEISWGDWRILDQPDAPDVLVMRYDWDSCTVMVMHSFGAEPRVVHLTANQSGNERLVDLLATHDSHADAHGRHVIELEPRGYRWFRAGGLYDGLAP